MEVHCTRLLYNKSVSSFHIKRKKSKTLMIPEKKENRNKFGNKPRKILRISIETGSIYLYTYIIKLFAIINHYICLYTYIR